ncbi:MAG: hypothetical protein KDD34_03280 [Bdellovibrionales bacterium]|nr:hypothetical protein [Bdellovibrionales bacterium]
MKVFKVISKSCFTFFLILFSLNGFASNVNWSGLYRIEGYSIKNSEFNSKGRQKDYGLSHLILRPSVVAADGLTIYSQFHIFNSATYPNSQVGQVFGNGPYSSGTANSFPNSNAGAQNQEEETLKVSQLYLSLVQEYGQLLVGRVPIHFGLGMYHNAGMGLFDHWYDNRDMVGYKIIMGNMWFLPMMAKVNEGELNYNRDITDFLFHFQYDNPESEIEMGLFWQIRKAGSAGGNDGPLVDPSGSNYWGAGATVASIDSENINLYVKKDTDRWMLGLEAGFQKGDIGVIDGNGSKVTQSGFGLAFEAAYRPEEGKSDFGLKAGIASGDDRSTTNEYEGYLFDRNYNIGFLMMNHTLGQADFMNTSINGGGPKSGENSEVDVETVSNVLYLAPSMTYHWSEKWSSQFMLVTGWLQQNTNSYLNNQTSKDLGYELDLSLTFLPKKGITWVNEIGLLMPGDAFKGDGNLDATFGYGMSSKAAISF